MTPRIRPSFRTLLYGCAATLAVFVWLGAAGARPAMAAPTPNSVLILGDTVCSQSTTGSCGTQSLEEQEARAAGFTTVKVATDTEWNSMTTTQFEAYQLIVFGDPNSCGADTMGPGSVAALTAPVWAPAVMNTGGNKVLIGTTPTRRYYIGGSDPHAVALEKQSLAYAGAVTGGTGVYVDLNCAYDGADPNTAIPFLDNLSTQSGSNLFQVMGRNPGSPPSGFDSKAACGTTVNIVASAGPTSGLTDSNLSGWDCSVDEAFTQFPSDYTPLVVASYASGFPNSYCANDVESSTQACGAPYILASGGGVNVSSNISLSPSSQDIATSTSNSATLTATVTNGGTPVGSGTPVTFTITSGPNAPKTVTQNTDASGQATFTYTSGGVSGTDAISASFTDPSSFVEKSLASVTWKGPVNGDDYVGASAANLSGTEGAALGNPTVATITDTDGDSGASDWTTSVNWGDGTSSTSGAVSSTGTANQYALHADHTYAEPGVYTVTTTITDTDNPGDTTTVSSTATILEGTLAVTTAALTPTEGGFSGQVATFTDTDLGQAPGNYTATIDWGDGGTSTGTVAAVTGTPGSFTVSGSHAYADPGSDPVKVTITEGDASSSTASDTATATVAEAPITVTAGTLTVNQNQAFSGQVATFTDGDPLPAASDYTATIHWGDGATTSGTVAGSAGSFTVSGGHTYTSAGSYPLSVTVSESDDSSATGTGTGSTTSISTAFTVKGRGTVFLPAEKFSGTVANVTYGTPSAPATSFAATINWGDGTTGPGTISGSGGSYTVSGSHTFKGAGPYAVKVTVTDPISATGSATTTFEIPSTTSALSIPGVIQGKTFLCFKRHHKCPGVPILGSFLSGGSAVWNVTLSKSGKHQIVLGHLTQTVKAGRTTVVFKVTNRPEAKRLYRLVRKHKLNMLSVQQVFTNTAGASSQTTLFSRVVK